MWRPGSSAGLSGRRAAFWSAISFTHYGLSSSSGAGSSCGSFFIGDSFFTRGGTEEYPTLPSWMTIPPERHAGAG
jgi:hypothetical protein